MTTPVLATIVFSAESGLPEDAVVCDMSFLAANTSSGTLDGIADSIESFWVTDNTHDPIGGYYGTSCSRAADGVAINFYDLTGHLDGSPHGSPVGVRDFTLPSRISGGVDYPAEVAVVVTFNADGYTDVAETAVNPSPPPATIRPRARYRGRIYLGPVISLAGGNDANGNPRPGGNFFDDLDAAAFRFMDERGGDFAVWSRADEVLRLVAPDGTWTVDDAYDTQRRRGPDRTTRALIWP